jgi:hypothetical protein
MLKEFVALSGLLHLLRLSARFVAGGFFCCWLIQGAVAGDTPAGGNQIPAPPLPPTSLGGLSWGLGLAADFDIGGKRVNNATVVNNIIRATDTSNNVDVSFVLEAHYFFVAKEKEAVKKACASNPPSSISPFDWINCTVVATGPFVALEVGSSSGSSSSSGVITGYALGWMVGLQHPNAPKTVVSTWNLGIGLRVDPKAQVLGDGLVLNQPLPPMDSIRFKTEPRLGLMLLSSFGF